MELIPIFAFIVLMLTIATFILAIGAYILYKIKERNNKISRSPETIDAEVIAPSPIASASKKSAVRLSSHAMQEEEIIQRSEA